MFSYGPLHTIDHQLECIYNSSALTQDVVYHPLLPVVLEMNGERESQGNSSWQHEISMKKTGGEKKKKIDEFIMKVVEVLVVIIFFGTLNSLEMLK